MVLLPSRADVYEPQKADYHQQLRRRLHSRLFPDVNVDTFLMGNHQRISADSVFFRDTRRLVKQETEDDGSWFREESILNCLNTTKQQNTDCMLPASEAWKDSLR